MLQIRLENTLCDFFAAEDSRTSTPSTSKIFVSYNPISDRDITANLPRNTKYLVQQWRGSGLDDSSSTINLILMPQRMSWIVGKMPVTFIKYEEQDEQSIYRNVEDDLEETINILDPSCRFEPRFCSSIEQIRLAVGNSLVIPFLPSDVVANLPHHTNPDDHYELLTKRALALSDLPTPEAQLIDFDAPETGTWETEKLNIEVARAISVVRHRRRPFALKTNSAGGTKGTYLVRTLADYAAVENDLTIRLPTELHKLSSENAHLAPCSLVLTDILPGIAVAINFYVRYDGRAQFLSCCEQIFSETGCWLGGAVTYSKQTQLETYYRKVTQKTAAFLHSRGYRGPAGIDVMTDEAGRHYVVDLNPRPTGSFILGCLRPHFSDELAMDVARVMPFMMFPASRDEFRVAFDKELQAGEIVVLAWFSDPKLSQSHMCLAIGGRSKELMEQLCSRVQRWVGDFQL